MLKKLTTILTLLVFLSIAAYSPVQGQAPQEPTAQPDSGLSKKAEIALMDKYLVEFYENAAKIRGVKLVESAKTVDTKELPIDFVKGFRNLEKFERQGIGYVLRYAAIDFKMAQENRYGINGINYRIFVLTKENGNWKVAEMGLVPVDQVVAQNLGFGDNAEREMADIYKDQAKGIFRNRQGKIVDRLNVATEEDLKKEVEGKPLLPLPEEKWSSLLPVRINPYYKRPQFIKVLMTTTENKQAFACESDCVQEIDFLAYIQNVFANTWPKDAPPEALKAGALAVKMYSWFSIVVNPTAGQMNADVIDTDPSQKYVATPPAMDEEERKKTEAMMSVFFSPDVAGIGFKDGLSHGLFLPLTSDQRDLTWATGILSRPGAVELAKQGKDAAEILQHYFEGSDRMEEAVAPLTFYRYAKTAG
ncbi:SpoIID/LytB domain-containing protein [Paenibacillus sp. MMS18-CY102]|uniref:SpoIID/LytB domain-containing protein n=1 Tax=Paenibacillus sp. MMS18-CY102 TaxID=2682849 RepID=UPI001366350C|nr:SpoIID/LytB domain-containing protein [Paenibacillus sp. MMS18-CY102]MWC30498.1 hypothetical protein [Paenibacillus sp. MMS18-CY102]